MAEEQEDQAPEMSPAEQRARDDGWRPQEDWKGDPGDWVDFKEFNLRGELMNRIKEQSGVINSLNHKIEERDQTLEDMVEMQSKIAKREYDKAMADLKKQKAEALENDDYEGVVNLDEEIADLKANQPKVESKPKKAEQQEDGLPPEIEAWLNDPKNSWYHSDTVMRAMADGIAVDLQQQGVPPAQMLKQVEETLRRELPHKFKGQRTPDVDDGGEYTGDRGSRDKKPTVRDLTDEQRRVGERYVRVIKDYTMEKYIDSLIEAGEL